MLRILPPIDIGISEDRFGISPPEDVGVSEIAPMLERAGKYVRGKQHNYSAGEPASRRLTSIPSGSTPFPKIRPVPDGDAPPRGWTAVGFTMWKLGGGPRWLASTRPEERVGRSILLFHRQ